MLEPGAAVPTADVGQLGRADLDGSMQVLAAARAIYSDADFSYDLTWVGSPTTRIGGESGRGQPDFGLTLIRLAGGTATFVPLGPASAATLSIDGAVAFAP